MKSAAHVQRFARGTSWQRYYFVMEEAESQDIALEIPADDVFIAPSIHEDEILLGRSYTHHSLVPGAIMSDILTECVLGVDEAGRGPVLGMEFIYPQRSSANTEMQSKLTTQAQWSMASCISP